MGCFIRQMRTLRAIRRMFYWIRCRCRRCLQGPLTIMTAETSLPLCIISQKVTVQMMKKLKHDEFSRLFVDFYPLFSTLYVE